MSSDLGVLNKQPTVSQKRRGHRGGRRIVAQKVRSASPVRAIQKDQERESDEDGCVFGFDFKSALKNPTQSEQQKRKEDKMWEKRQQKFFDSVRKIENDQVKPIAPPISGQFDAKPDMVTAYSFEPETRKTEDVLKDYLERRFKVDRLYRKQETPENYMEQLAQNDVLINNQLDREPAETTQVIRQQQQQINCARMPPSQAAVRASQQVKPIPALYLVVDEDMPKAHHDALYKYADRLQLQVDNLTPAAGYDTAQLDSIQQQLRTLKRAIFAMQQS